MYLAVVLSPAVFVLAFGPETSRPFLHDVGRVFALTGFTILVLQVALASRAKWMERPYGLDMVYAFHRRMAVLAGVILVLHPLLIAAAAGSTRLLFALEMPWPIWLARVALTILIAQIFLSTFRARLGVKYERWRLVHNVLAVSLIAAAFTHGLVTSNHDLRVPQVRTLWFALLGLAAVFYGWRKIMLPLYLRRHPWKVVDAHRETHDIWTITFRPGRKRERFDYLPGQFQFVTLRRGRGLPVEEHPFSLSSSPVRGNSVSTSIKESGDFTRRIGETRIGDTTLLEGPFGRFSYLLHPEDGDIIFIAGGIGITPIMSMLRHMRDTRYGHDVLLLYANRSENDIAFRGELAKMETAGDFPLRVIHVLEHPGSGWRGETGRIDHEILERFAGKPGRRAFYVCGPWPMMKGVFRTLGELGIPDRYIRAEVFRL